METLLLNRCYIYFFNHFFVCFNKYAFRLFTKTTLTVLSFCTQALHLQLFRRVLRPAQGKLEVL